MTCTRCGRSHDGEPMRAWFEKRGKDPSGIKLCATCVCDALGDLFDEADAQPQCTCSRPGGRHAFNCHLQLDREAT